ncbi:hypothetical protein [Archangium sp.]|jgi:hypothetical protein|uniref:hypothetical protein n=1 Tax=Archangium sp. TaxID=1872627 RepID=UPI002ED805CF
MRDKADIRRDFLALAEVEPGRAQERGRLLEALLHDLLAYEALSPQRRQKPVGEEVDLTFTDGHRHFLVEVKWAKKLSASDVFAFRGKLEGKLSGTLGVFVFVGGQFSASALSAMSWGRQINTVLFDGTDLEFALSPEHSFKQVLDVKLRRAASLGDVYFAYRSFLNEGER